VNKKQRNITQKKNQEKETEKQSRNKRKTLAKLAPSPPSWNRTIATAAGA
jgi:hypothetical protein